MRPTRVFIIYDHPLFARGLERLLQGVRCLTVLGAAAWREAEVLPKGATEADVIILEKPRGTSEADAAVTRLLSSRPGAGSFTSAWKITRSPCIRRRASQPPSSRT